MPKSPFFRALFSRNLFRLLLLSLVMVLLFASLELNIRTATATGPTITRTIFYQISFNTASFNFQTDQPGTASITLTNTAQYSVTKTDTSNTSHDFSFTLSPGVTYYYQFSTSDNSGDTTTSNVASFTTAASSNSFYFSNLSLQTSGNAIVISWTTTQSGDTQLDYGLNSSYGTTATQTGYRTQHNIQLNNLSSGLLYHFRISDTVSGGSNSLASPDMTFTAPGSIVITPTPTNAPPTATFSPTPTFTPSNNATPTFTPSNNATPTPTPNGNATATPTSINNATPTFTPVGNATFTATPLPGATLTPTPSGSNPTLAVDQLQLNFSGTSSEVSNGLGSQSLKLTSNAPLNWLTQPFTNSGGNWLVVNPLSGTLSAYGGTGQYASGLTVSVQAVNLAPGQYNGGLFINNTTNPSQAALIVAITLNVSGVGVTATATPNSGVTPTTTPKPPVSGFTYYLPYLSNGADGFVTYLTLQNQGAGKANVTINYFDEAGHTFGTAATNQIAAGALWNPTNGFTVGTSGNAQIISDQPLNIVVSENTPTGGSAFLLNKVTASSLIAPLVLRRAYGNFSTSIYLQNVSANQTNVKVSYYAANGTLAQTQNVTLGAHASTSLDQTDAVLNLPDNFVGWAVLDAGTGNTICAQVLESNPSIAFTATFGAVATPFSGANNSTTGAGLNLYAPAVFNGAFGSFYSGMTLVNPNNAPANVTVNYYDPSQGRSVLTQNFRLAANAAQLIFHGDPTLGLPAHFYGSAIVNSDQALVGVLNENGGGATSGTYNLLTGGGQTIYLPVVARKAFNGFVSGLTVLNLTSNVVNFSLQYYDSQGNPAGAYHNYTLAPHGSQPVYQDTASEQLPIGFFGTAQLLADSPGSLAVITNVANNQYFYTYTSP